MKIRGEYKVPIEDVLPAPHWEDWCKEYVADIIRNQMVEQGLIEFTAERKDGYYVFAGEVSCENPERVREIDKWLL